MTEAAVETATMEPAVVKSSEGSTSESTMEPSFEG
jgi:hypothetical protein